MAIFSSSFCCSQKRVDFSKSKSECDVARDVPKRSPSFDVKPGGQKECFCFSGVLGRRRLSKALERNGGGRVLAQQRVSDTNNVALPQI